MKKPQKRVKWPPVPGPDRLPWNEWHAKWHRRGGVPGYNVEECNSRNRWGDYLYFSMPHSSQVYASSTPRMQADAATKETGCKSLYLAGYNSEGVLDGPD